MQHTCSQNGASSVATAHLADSPVEHMINATDCVQVCWKSFPRIRATCCSRTGLLRVGPACRSWPTLRLNLAHHMVLVGNKKRFKCTIMCMVSYFLWSKNALWICGTHNHGLFFVIWARVWEGSQSVKETSFRLYCFECWFLNKF